MHLTLHMTARCNLRCAYCYAAPHSGGDMTFETARAAIDMALRTNDFAADGSLGVIFFGGEPLLMRELIAEVMRYCRGITDETGRQFHHKVTTNGLLLDDEFLTDPLTSGIFVAMSHDGVQRAHDAHRVCADGSGSFALLEDKIELLLRRKPYSPAMMVVTPETVSNYSDSVQYLYGKGFRYLICSLNYGSEWDESHVEELREQYRSLADWYYRETLREEKFYFSPFETKISAHIFPGSCRAERCELGRRQISVAPNGRLYPCVQFVGDGSDDAFAIGDVLSGIDERARAMVYAANSGEKSECSDCAIRERCNHFCGCLNKQATGSVTTVSPALCAHERTVLPIADRLAERLYRKKSAMFVQKHYNEMFPVISLAEDSSRA